MLKLFPSTPKFQFLTAKRTVTSKIAHMLIAQSIGNYAIVCWANFLIVRRAVNVHKYAWFGTVYYFLLALINELHEKLSHWSMSIFLTWKPPFPVSIPMNITYLKSWTDRLLAMSWISQTWSWSDLDPYIYCNNSSLCISCDYLTIIWRKTFISIWHILHRTVQDWNNSRYHSTVPGL